MNKDYRLKSDIARIKNDIECVVQQLKDKLGECHCSEAFADVAQAIEDNATDTTTIEADLTTIISKLQDVVDGFDGIQIDTGAMEALLEQVKDAILELEFDSTEIVAAIEALSEVNEGIKEDTEELVRKSNQTYAATQILVTEETVFDLSQYSSFAYTLVGGTATVDLDGETLELPLGNFVGASLNTDSKKALSGTFTVTPAEQSGVLIIALSVGEDG